MGSFTDANNESYTVSSSISWLACRLKFFSGWPTRVGNSLALNPIFQITKNTLCLTNTGQPYLNTSNPRAPPVESVPPKRNKTGCISNVSCAPFCAPITKAARPGKAGAVPHRTREAKRSPISRVRTRVQLEPSPAGVWGTPPPLLTGRHRRVDTHPGAGAVVFTDVYIYIIVWRSCE